MNVGLLNGAHGQSPGLIKPTLDVDGQETVVGCLINFNVLLFVSSCHTNRGYLHPNTDNEFNLLVKMNADFKGLCETSVLQWKLVVRF